MAVGLAIPALAGLLDRLAFSFSLALAADQSLPGLITLVVDQEELVHLFFSKLFASFCFSGGPFFWPIIGAVSAEQDVVDLGMVLLVEPIFFWRPLIWFSLAGAGVPCQDRGVHEYVPFRDPSVTACGRHDER
eukprot:16448203-Heterocapsa_arctica.AAC.1